MIYRFLFHRTTISIPKKLGNLKAAFAVDPFFSLTVARIYKRDLKNVEDYYFDVGRYALQEECDTIAEKIIQFCASEIEVQSNKSNNKQVKNRFDRSLNLKQQVKV